MISLTKPRRMKSLLVPFVIILLMAIVFLGLLSLYSIFFTKNDFALFIRQNVLWFWQGQNPYQGPGPYNPPWLYIILVPLLFVPVPLGATILTLLNLTALTWLLYRSHTSLPVFLMVLASPVVLSLVMTANVDGLLLIGALLPPQWGLFLVLAKPQLGVGIALYWAWEAYRAGGIRRVMQIFTPVTLAYILSFTVYGVYLLKGTSLVSTGWNINRFLFPYLILPGIVLLIVALRQRRFSLSYGVGPLLSPYARPNSYIGLIPAFAWDWRWALAAWVLEWGVFLVNFVK